MPCPRVRLPDNSLLRTLGTWAEKLKRGVKSVALVGYATSFYPQTENSPCIFPLNRELESETSLLQTAFIRVVCCRLVSAIVRLPCSRLCSSPNSLGFLSHCLSLTSTLIRDTNRQKNHRLPRRITGACSRYSVTSSAACAIFRTTALRCSWPI